MPIYQVAVFKTNRDYFDYFHPQASLLPGCRVWVPFRNTTRLGIIVDCIQTETPGLKTIQAIVDPVSLIPQEIMQLCRWISQYYHAPLAQVLSLALPKRYRQGKTLESLANTYYRLSIPAEMALTKLSARAHKQRKLLKYLENVPMPPTQNQLVEAGYSVQIIRELMDKNIIDVEKKPLQPQVEQSIHPIPNKYSLNPEQQSAVETIALAFNTYHCFLLFGVTGSGKTEVYSQLIDKIMCNGQQVLILVPEIGLTPQLQHRFQERFAQSMVVIHSQMNDRERQQAWQWASLNQVQLVIGTRSALLTPMPKLGLIVIDEEHDPSLKQMDGVRYFARDTALMRAQALRIPIVLGSATPSLESFANADKGKYTLLRLTQKAMNQTPLHYQMIDLRNQTLKHGLAQKTLQLIEQQLARDNQVLVFINRRGYAPVFMCHSCGWKAQCRACDANLIAHKVKQTLICHHCGYTQTSIHHCPQCSSRELMYIGAGTQRIEEGLQNLFPKTSVLRIDRDVVRNKHSLQDHLQTVHSGKAQLIVGTQMLAKGHHFPKLSMVVIADADYGFYNQDFRALERLAQLLVQVSGRVGREKIAGEVLIQTHIPEHPVLKQLLQSGYEVFARQLLKERQQAQLPPYTSMALIRVHGKQKDQIHPYLSQLKPVVQHLPITLLGPAPAPLLRKANDYHMQLLLKSPSRQLLQAGLSLIEAWMRQNPAKGLCCSIDVDPVDLL